MDADDIRIRRIIRENRILKVLMMLSASLLGGGLLMAFNVRSELASQSIRVLDKDGAARLELTTEDDGTPVLVLKDKAKGSRIRFTVSDKNTPLMTFISGDGTPIGTAPRPRD
jgi:hypothetical protein